MGVCGVLRPVGLRFHRVGSLGVLWELNSLQCLFAWKGSKYIAIYAELGSVLARADSLADDED